jgi:hypothetical protein
MLTKINGVAFWVVLLFCIVVGMIVMVGSQLKDAQRRIAILEQKIQSGEQGPKNIHE